MNTVVVELQLNEAGELYIELPDQLLENLGWSVGDDLEWTASETGSWILTKKENK